MASLFAKLWNMFFSAPPTTNARDVPVAEKKTSILGDIIGGGSRTLGTAAQAIATLASGEPMDDKDLLLEHGVEMLQKLPPNSGLGDKVAGAFIKLLWNDLPHPPGTIAGPETRYRRHDGGNNNLWSPEMGKAGSAYSRSVPADKTKGNNLPDPELVFEQLLKRKGPFRKHPSGLNRLFFSFATIVIHECFQTHRKKQWINETSSYVDLSTLYGNTSEEQKRVRTKVNGTIFPDSIASERIMLMPPGVVAVLMMFSRNHNAIAHDLFTVNEEGKYKPWDSLSKEDQTWQDNDIFQLSRNINVGFFASVVLHDYVAAILNTPRADSTWWLNLGAEIKEGPSRVERGAGNVVSVEFAVLYHWHATLSAADAQWMEELIQWDLPKVKSLDDMTPELFHELIGIEAAKLGKTLPNRWEFGGIKRGEDGRFADADLGKIIKDCIEEPAHAFGAHGTPASLRVVDIMGQLQARNVFNVCTLNEFRRYLNLKAYESFEEWNPDKDVARAAELLYGHIENMELYPGLQAECTKPDMPGSGVCPGQTTGRGILDDAVALVRGDRFLTYDFNSSTLTNWGVSKLGNAVHPGAYGGVLPSLLFQALPGEFVGNSSYALLQFYTPEAQKEILTKNRSIAKYNTSRPASSIGIAGVVTQEGCTTVLADTATFRAMHQDTVTDPTDGHTFTLGFDEHKQHDAKSGILHKVFFEDSFDKNVQAYFSETVKMLIKKNTLAFQDTRRTIDIVRDVCNVAPIMWLADRFAIPIKSQEHPRGLVRITELFDAYMTLFTYQTFNVLPSAEWKVKEASIQASRLLRKIIEGHLKTQRGVQEGLVDWLAKNSAYEVKPDADRMYHAMNDSGLPIDSLVADCIGMSTPVAGNITQQSAVLIDLFLTPSYEQYKDRIVELAHKDDDNSFRELIGFVYEGMRHAGVVPGVPRLATQDTIIQDGERGSVSVKANQVVLVATSMAAMDPKFFPNPEKLDPSRPMSSYALVGPGMQSCLASRVVGPAIAAIIKEVFKLKGLKRSQGRQGMFSTIDRPLAGIRVRTYLDNLAKESPNPTNMYLSYEE